MLGSLQTTVEGVLGSVTTGLDYFFWSIGSSLTRNVQSSSGPKVTLILCTWLTTVWKVSEGFDVSCGVHQCCVLAPIDFVITILLFCESVYMIVGLDCML